LNHPTIATFGENHGAETLEQIALVRKVGRLVDCPDSAGLGMTAAHEEASQFALTAASDAESLLGLQREHIAELERLALTDELAGLLNRRAIATGSDGWAATSSPSCWRARHRKTASSEPTPSTAWSTPPSSTGTAAWWR
jgi:hypothetical protein